MIALNGKVGTIQSATVAVDNNNPPEAHHHDYQCAVYRAYSEEPVFADGSLERRLCERRSNGSKHTGARDYRRVTTNDIPSYPLDTSNKTVPALSR